MKANQKFTCATLLAAMSNVMPYGMFSRMMLEFVVMEVTGKNIFEYFEYPGKNHKPVR